jgi:hypothetical protein
MPARRRRRGARQRRAQGTIVPRGPDRWLIRWFVGQDAVTGKRRYSSRTVKGSKAEAIRALAQECGAVRGEVQDGGTLREFLIRWLADVLALRVSTKTLRRGAETWLRDVRKGEKLTSRASAYPAPNQTRRSGGS